MGYFPVQSTHTMRATAKQRWLQQRVMIAVAGVAALAAVPIATTTTATTIPVGDNWNKPSRESRALPCEDNPEVACDVLMMFGLCSDNEGDCRMTCGYCTATSAPATTAPAHYLCKV